MYMVQILRPKITFAKTVIKSRQNLPILILTTKPKFRLQKILNYQNPNYIYNNDTFIFNYIMIF